MAGGRMMQRERFRPEDEERPGPSRPKPKPIEFPKEFEEVDEDAVDHKEEEGE